MGQTSKVWRKLVILAFRLTFAPCVEALLKHSLEHCIYVKSFQPISLATDLEMLEGSYSGCTESGWSQQDRHLKLQKSNITILDTEKCQSEAEDGDQVPDTSFCGGTTNYYTG